MKRWGPVAVFLLLETAGCSGSDLVFVHDDGGGGADSSPNFADARAGLSDGGALADSGDAGVTDSSLTDAPATCSPPTASGLLSGSPCMPEGPTGCVADAGPSGWRYSCFSPDGGPFAQPADAGACQVIRTYPTEAGSIDAPFGRLRYSEGTVTETVCEVDTWATRLASDRFFCGSIGKPGLPYACDPDDKYPGKWPTDCVLSGYDWKSPMGATGPICCCP